MSKKEEIRPSSLAQLDVQANIINPSLLREHLSSRGVDEEIFDKTINPLKNELNSDENYRRIKDAAASEIMSLNPNVLQIALQKSAPYLQALPASHSKGHVSRDVVHIAELLNDPQANQLDDIELAIGVFGGAFHDIGNSIAPRYEEHRMLTAHAEAGAYLFGLLADNLLPPNFTKLTQFSIAAHTNHAERRVHKGDKEYRIEPYNDAIEGQNRKGVWLTRAADRAEIISIIQVARLVVAHAQPVIDYYVNPAEYRPRLPQDEFNRRYQLDRSADGCMLNELSNRVNSAISTDLNRHNKHDSLYMREEIFRKNADDLELFIGAVLSSKNYDIEDDSVTFKRIAGICRMLEPGSDIEEKIKLLNDKFYGLDEITRGQWLRGFDLLTSNQYPQFHERMKSRIKSSSLPEHSRSPFINGLVANVRKIAGSVLEAIDPKYINDPSRAPDVIDALIC